LIVKLLITLITIGILLGLFSNSILARTSMDPLTDGLQKASCHAANLVEMSLAGENVTRSGQEFLGLLPVIETMNTLEANLASGSPFINEVLTIVSSTEEIQSSVTLMEAVLQNLETMLQNPANVNPRSGDGTDLLHECTWCAELAGPIGDANTAFSAGVGSALAEVRDEIDKQLTGDKLTSLQESVVSAAAPLAGFKDSLHDMFGNIIEDDAFTALNDAARSAAIPLVAVLILYAICVSGCGMMASMWWVAFDKSDEYTAPSPIIHRCALCAWWNSCCLLMFSLFVGGIFTLIMAPFSSMCLILDDLDGTMMQDIAAAFEVEGFSGESAESQMMLDIVDNCIANWNSVSTEKNLLKIVTVRDEDGIDTTMYDLVIADTKTQITEKFDNLGGSSSTASLATNADFISLRTLLRETPVDAMMLPRSSHDFQNDVTYNAMASDGDLNGYYFASVACSDFASVSGETIPGIKSFADELNTKGTASSNLVTSSCPSAFDTVCSSASCEAGQQLLELKEQVWEADYQCVHFTNAAGTACDIGSMQAVTGSSPVVYAGDCQGSNGDWTTMSQSCTLSEFKDLIYNYDDYIDKAAQRMDTVSDAVNSKINTDLRRAVDECLISHLNKIGEGLMCGFMGREYQSFINGMCYQALAGSFGIAVAYVQCGVCCILLCMIIYVVWRIALDNHLIRGQKQAEFDSNPLATE